MPRSRRRKGARRKAKTHKRIWAPEAVRKHYYDPGRQPMPRRLGPHEATDASRPEHHG